MNQREDMGRRLYVACLSGSVSALEALIEEDQLILDRVSSFTGFFNDTHLHVAVLRGHLDFTKALLIRKPKLPSELDSLRCSPLHIASTEGHVEIVQELLRVTTDVCIARDQDGRIPLHLAAMKGRVEVTRQLLGAEANSIHEKLNREETILHLCVKYNRLEALKTLVQYLQSNDKESLLHSRDDDGNTILHLAASLKQMDTIEYLLGIKCVKDHANVRNQNGSTALDVVDHCPNRDLKTMEIREFLLQAGVRRSVSGGPYPNPELPPNNTPPRPRRCCLLRCISGFWTKYIYVDNEWLKEVRGHLITTGALMASMAYQSILSPPGSFWQEGGNGKLDAGYASPPIVAGHAILDSKYLYNDYLFVNTIVLVASLTTIMLAMTGFRIGNNFLTWLMIVTVYVTIICTVLAYWMAMCLTSPHAMGDTLTMIYGWPLLGWWSLCIFVAVVYTCRFLVLLVNKLKSVKLVEACCRCCVP